MEHNVIDELKQNIKDLTGSERKVADFIINNTSEVMFDTINELSKKVGTSTTTVMRLASKLGYSGYSELQDEIQSFIKLHNDPQTRLTSNLQNIEEDQLWNQTIAFHMSQLNHFITQINHEAIEGVVDLIDKSQKIFCTCVQSGLPVGQYFSQNINRIKGNCKLINADVSDWIDEIINMTHQDLLFVVSFPRYAKRIRDFAMIAKEKGVTVVVITDTYSSPLIDYGDIIIPCDSKSLAFHNSPVLAMIAVDYIINAVAVNESSKESNRLEEVNEILKRINYHSK